MILRVVLVGLLLALPLMAREGRPNILLIVTDDQRPDTIHALGNGVIETPNIDRLVGRGTAFTRAYAAYPICHVSRAEILTGCNAFRALPRYPGAGIDPALRTFAQTFRDGGYHTWYVGKWHNDGLPRQRGYEATRGLFTSGGGRGQQQPEADERGHPLTGYRGWTFKTDEGKVEIEKGVGLTPRTSEHIANGAIELVTASRKDEPFFLHVNFSAPHDPRLWPAGHERRYDPARIPLPRNFAPQHPFDHGNFDGRDEKLLPKPLVESDVRTELAIYYALITDLDSQIGRILGALDAHGVRDDTVIIFTSDQGLAIGSHGLLGKQNQYEHTARVPLILAGPGIPAGRRSDALCHLRDLFPSACELAGIAIPATVQAASLVPVLRGKKASVREDVIGYFTDTQRMICDGRWKLIVYPKAKRIQLFDLGDDPDELHDRSGDPSVDRVRLAMAARLRDWLKENGDAEWQSVNEVAGR